MSLLILIGLAKANDHFKKPWLFSAIYTALIMLLKLLIPSSTATFASLFLSAGFSFIVVGILLSLLLHFEDNILMWLASLAAGLFVLGGGARLLLGGWLAL